MAFARQTENENEFWHEDLLLADFEAMGSLFDSPMTPAATAGCGKQTKKRHAKMNAKRREEAEKGRASIREKLKVVTPLPEVQWEAASTSTTNTTATALQSPTDCIGALHDSVPVPRLESPSVPPSDQRQILSLLKERFAGLEREVVVMRFTLKGLLKDAFRRSLPM